jgi:hypothetical protein
MTTTTIYVGTLWHLYNDPFISVIGLDPTAVQKELEAIAADTYQDMADTYCCSECWESYIDPEDICDQLGHEPDDDICSSGVSPEPFDNLESFICDQHTVDEAIDTLTESGLFVC